MKSRQVRASGVVVTLVSEILGSSALICSPSAFLVRLVSRGPAGCSVGTRGCDFIIKSFLSHPYLQCQKKVLKPPWADSGIASGLLT